MLHIFIGFTICNMLVKKIKYPFTPKEYKKIYSKVPRLCVELVIQDKKGILFSLRKAKSWNGMWHLPGGTLYHGETLSKCIDRVARDELGIKLNKKKFLGYIEYLQDEKNRRSFGTSVGLLFLCMIKSGKIRGSDQAEQIDFFKRLPINIIPAHRTFLKKVLKIK